MAVKKADGGSMTPTEYHRHTDGDVVRGSAARCIDPNAGAVDVYVIAPDPNGLDLASAWVDYRKDYGVSADDMMTAHKAFVAGWKGAREGDQSGVLR